ncbi:MAG: RidA family protein [Acidobacteriota bacterium]
MKPLYLIGALICFGSVFEGNAQGQSSDSKQQPANHAGPGTTQQAPSVEHKGRSGSPLSEVVRVGPMLYLSGQLGVNAAGALAAGGIKAETKQVMENIRNILEKNASGMERVVKCTVMLLDIAERPAMSEVYAGYFPRDRMPARSTFGVTGLALGARVEIECMATVK